LPGYNGRDRTFILGNYEYLADSSGLITKFDYYTSTTATGTTAGSVAGYLQQTKVQRGESGTAIVVSAQDYYARSANGTTIVPVASSTVYANTDGTGGRTTNFSYTWFGSTAQVESVTVTHPTVTTAQNGPNSADTEIIYFDTAGRPIWHKDGDGALHYTAFDPVTGAVTKTITDVDTDLTSDFVSLPSGWSSPSGLHLITLAEVDGLGRTTKLTDPNGNVTYVVYKDTTYEVRVYVGWDSGTNKPTGPTLLQRTDRANGYAETLTMSAAPALDGSNKPTGAESVSGLQSLARSYLNSAGQVTHSDVYFSVGGLTYSTSASLGTENTHFYRTHFGYGANGWLERTQTPTGTIYRDVYDAPGRVVSQWVGLDDTPTSGTWSPTNNSGADMVQVSAFEYDSGGVGDGNLTKSTAIPGGGAADRVTQFWFDWRNRLVVTKGGVQGSEATDVNRPLAYIEYNNLDEVVVQEQYDGDNVSVTTTNGVPDRPSSSLLRAKSTASYDAQGRVYYTATYSVSPSDGTVSSNALTSDVWYGRRGQVLKSAEPGGLVSKNAHDGAGRLTASYQTDGGGDSGWGDADDVTGDAVLAQTEYTYDAAGNVTLTTTRQRFHDEADTGALGTPSSGVNARVSYVASYYDKANRLTDTVDVGTYGGSAYTRPSTPDSRSDTALVTSYAYQADEVQTVTLTGAPTGGTFTLTFGGQTTSGIAYNASAATVKSALEGLSSIGSGNVLVQGGAGGPWVVRFAGTLAGADQAQLTGSGSGLTGGSSPAVALSTTSQGGDAGRLQTVTDPRGLVAKTDYDGAGRTVRTVGAFTDFVPSGADDATTEFSYDGSGHLLTVSAVLPDGGVQRTQYVYGVTTSGGSGVNSNDLLAEVRHPDKSTGLPSTSEKDVSTVNALGQTRTVTDRNGNVHTYTYDVLGRVVSDAVTTLGSGVDGAVRRIEYAYDSQGNAYLITSFDAASGGNIVNQVQREFNGLGQLTKEYQAHSGAVNTGTTPKVQYAYSEMSGGANHSRLTTLTYPNGRALTFNYTSGLDSTISRLSSITDGSTTLEAYSYLGLAVVVKRAHGEPGVDLTYLKQSGESDGEAGDQYAGLDRFYRIRDQRWRKTSDGSHTDRFQYGHDRDGNRLYRDNLINNDFDELYHANGASGGYDNLNQLVAFRRGPLSDSNSDNVPDTVTTASRSQSWTLDATGNWDSLTSDGTPQSRTHNRQNQVTGVGSSSLTFDGNGNLKTDEAGQQYVYDAWNRLVQVKDSGNTVLASYKYDGLGRRIVETVGGTTRDLYYSAAWQVLEERVSGQAQVQYVWSPVYVDALILRDRDTDGNGSLDERLYVQQDANYNVTALVNTSGQVVERFIEDAYGKVTVLAPDWSTRSSSNYDWRYLHQGGRYEWVTGLYHVRRRDYDPDLGRWLQRDPLGLAPDINPYRYVGNGPTNATDPTGLARRIVPVRRRDGTIRLYEAYDPPIRSIWDVGVASVLQAGSDLLNGEVSTWRYIGYIDPARGSDIRREGIQGTVRFEWVAQAVRDGDVTNWERWFRNSIAFARQAQGVAWRLEVGYDIVTAWNDAMSLIRLLTDFGIGWTTGAGIFIGRTRFTFNFRAGQSGQWWNAAANRTATREEIAAIQRVWNPPARPARPTTIRHAGRTLVVPREINQHQASELLHAFRMKPNDLGVGLYNPTTGQIHLASMDRVATGGHGHLTQILNLRDSEWRGFVIGARGEFFPTSHLNPGGRMPAEMAERVAGLLRQAGLVR
ncbi:MAG: hypothetical protein L0Z62_40735, partial [Gemmataceae bacterium]|nr:hypothetical protein [Gemmataceae bacterium]